MIGSILFALTLQASDPANALAAARQADAAAAGLSLTEYDRAQAAAFAAAQAAKEAAANAEFREEETPGQDIEWAATVAAALQSADLNLRDGLTGAQTETCGQILDRIGAWRQQRAKLRATQDAARLQRLSMTGEFESEWKTVSSRMLDVLDAQIGSVVVEGDRAGHALMSANLAFCMPR